LQNTQIGSVTNTDGFFTIAKVPIGSYNMLITYIGYDTLIVPVIVNENEIHTGKYYITPSLSQLKEVEITAEREEMKTEVRIAVTKITPKQIKKIPTIGGEPDIAQYLQILPGVVFTGDQGGQLYIRGGSPIQNKILLDGMTIYSPFHSIGLFSVFDSEIIRNTDVYTGGFNAEYGGRISSIMDIQTIDGNKKKLSGKISSNTFSSKLFLEGPLAKNEKSSFIFSGKTSYLDKSFENLYKSLYTEERLPYGLPYTYTDLYGKISMYGTRSKFNLFGFNFQDEVNYQMTSLGWNSNGIGGQFVLIPSNLVMTIEGNFAYSKYSVRFNEKNEDGNELEKYSNITGYGVGFDFTYFYKNSELKYGLDVNALETNYSIPGALSNDPKKEDQSTSEFSGYINYKYKTNRFILEPGFRLQRYGTYATSAEPRIGLKYIVNERLRLKVASGSYSQNILSTTSDKDIINLFAGIITAPEEDITPDQRLQKSNHLVAGIEYDVSLNIDFQIEGYVKDFTQLTNLNRNQVLPNDPIWITEKGTARGIDVLLKYNHNSLYFWGVYSLGFITRNDGYIEYSPHFDRRHNINLVSSYKFGNKKSWKLDLRWNLGSGLPFTQTLAFFEDLSSLFGQDGINTDYTSGNGTLGLELAELNRARLPYYHRLDFSITKNIEITKKSYVEITTSVTNVYNRDNIFYINRIEQKPIYQLPVLPSLGVTFKF
ncbi:MAG: TonB-dependent receptor, partial [Bacteroidota bacterium]|nr:TonB-dependent receptor [Bacteroidota bacterium]